MGSSRRWVAFSPQITEVVEENPCDELGTGLMWVTTQKSCRVDISRIFPRC